MYLSEFFFTCPKEQIMHKELSLALTVLKPNINSFVNSMKPDIYCIENRVDPDQLASEPMQIRIHIVFHTTCEFTIINRTIEVDFLRIKL